MRLTIARRDIHAALRSAKCARPRRAHILLEARAGTLRVSAKNAETTDFEMTLSATVPATVAEDGDSAVPGQELCAVVGHGRGDRITLASDGDRITIASDDGHAPASLTTMPAGAWPSMATIAMPPAIGATADARAFRRDLAFVLQGASHDKKRRVLNGIAMTFQPCLRLAASDGYRLAVADAGGDTTGDGTAIIHREAARRFLAAVPIPTGEVSIAVSSGAPYGQARMAIGGVTMETRTLEGPFPQASRIIPIGELAMSFTVDASVMLAALMTLVEVAARDEKMVRLHVNTRAGSVAILAGRRRQRTQTRIEVNATGRNMRVAYNVIYLLDLLRSVGPLPITINARDGSSVSRIDVAGDRAWTYAIMPMRSDHG